MVQSTHKISSRRPTFSFFPFKLDSIKGTILEEKDKFYSKVMEVPAKFISIQWLPFGLDDVFKSHGMLNIRKTFVPIQDFPGIVSNDEQ